MCLKLESTEPPTQEIEAWKVVTRHLDDRLYSTFFPNFLCNRASEAVLESSRITTELTAQELVKSRVEEGFHACVTKSGAEFYKKCFEAFCGPLAVIKLTAKPEDFVARGYTIALDQKIPTVVYTKLYYDPKNQEPGDPQSGS